MTHFTEKVYPSEQSSVLSKALLIVATCWVISLVVLVLSVVGMRYATGLPHLVPIAGLELPTAYSNQLTVESDRERFRSELAPIVAKFDTTEGKALAILEWVMNQIPKVENRYAKSSWQMIEIGRAGGGLICGGMAQIFRDALISAGIPARRVFLQRNLFDSFDTHVTVEAFVDGKWRLYDPTFHIALKSSTQFVGALDSRSWFFNRKGQSVEIEFLGDVQYPARYDKYPIRYELLFSNPSFEIQQRYSVLNDVPFFGRIISKVNGVWFGAQWGYPKMDAALSWMAQDFYRFLYLLTLEVLPVINLVLLFAMILLWRRIRYACQ